MFVYNSKYKFNANGTADILMNYGEGTEYYTTQTYTATRSYNEGKLSVSNVTISPSDTEVDSSALFINFPKAAEIAENPVTILLMN